MHTYSGHEHGAGEAVKLCRRISSENRETTGNGRVWDSKRRREGTGERVQGPFLKKDVWELGTKRWWLDPGLANGGRGAVGAEFERRIRREDRGTETVPPPQKKNSENWVLFVYSSPKVRIS